MHVALIVQLSIAMLARELAGGLPIGAAAGAGIALLGPLVAYTLGAHAAWRARRGMDRRDPDAAVPMLGFAGRAGWIGAIFMMIAASSELPATLSSPLGAAIVSVYLFVCGIASILAAFWNAWSVEARIREAAIIRTLDAARPLHPMPTRAAYVLAQARAGLLPVIAPLIVPVVLGELAAGLAREHAPGSELLAHFGGAMLGVLTLFLLVPLIIPPLLGLRRLPHGEMRDDLERLAATAGIGVREIWVWPTDGLVANAAVMGVFPRLRCVMLSDALLEGLPREQVLAVMAHELGHVARRHLLWMLPVLIGAGAIASLIAEPLAEAAARALVAGAGGGPDGPEVGRDVASIVSFLALARDLAVLVIAILVFGFVSRRFERQADTFAVQLLSGSEGRDDASAAAVGAMTGALSKVAYLNHVPIERPSWRHGSIAWRQTYLRSLVGLPHANLPIDRLVRVICLAALLLAAFAIGAIAWTRLGA